MLLLLSIAELFGMTVWFSTSAIGPALSSEWGLHSDEIAWFVMAVQLGFVTGTFVIAITNLADLFSARYLFTISALLSAVANGVFPFWGDKYLVGLLLRFLTGICLAGVYPPGMKIIAGWFKTGRGLAIGVMVGALTMGTALPHLVRSMLQERWQLTIYVSSILAAVAGLIVLFLVVDGPYQRQARRFDFRYVATIMKNKPLRLAYMGYFGHMWELYAMWTWVPIFLQGRLGSHGPIPSGLAGFLVIASGAVGCAIYGLWADRIGRSRSTMTAMLISGSCCFLVGTIGHAHDTLLLALCLLWGITVVADSAQFSAAASELCEQEYMGSVLTLQTSVGFLITLASIKLVPVIRDASSWGLAFGTLGLGPVLGIVAMARLFRLPEARKMANGNR